MRLLSRTPAPHPAEALFAYTLRLSEANCYPTPMYVARLAGVPRTHWLRPYPSYPANMLAPLIGGHEDALERMGYTTVVGNAIHFKLLDQDLGRGVADLMRLMAPAVCAQCVREEGHIGALWDMAAAVACTRHGRLAVEVCASCAKPLAWYRPGILRCRCNADIGNMTGSRADAILLDLMTILEAKFLHRSVFQCHVASPFPLRSFEDMPLFDFLRLIHVLGEAGRIGGLVAEAGKGHSAEPVRFAAGALLDWPRNLVTSLDAVDGSHAALAGKRVLNRIVNALFRRKPLSEGLRQLADALRPMLHTRRAVGDATRMAPENRISGRPDAEVGRGRTALRMAVLRLGIPASALVLLRSRGTYQSRVVRGQRQRWRPDELEVFGQRLTALALAKRASTTSVKLKVLLGRKFRNAVLKAELVEAVLQGALPVIGLAGDTPGDLLLEADAADRWVHEARLREGKGTITMTEAACATGLRPPAVPAAISAELLDAVVVDGVNRVTLASVNRFREIYIPIVQLAPRFNTSVRRLTRFVERHGIRVTNLIRPGKSYAEQPIIHRESLPKVEALWAEEQAQKAAGRSPLVHPGPERSIAFAAYLHDMNAKGEPLPRRAGQLDKSEIARACGFNRNEFYVRPGLAKLLDDAVLEEQSRAGLASFKPIDLLRTYLEECSHPGKRIPRYGSRPNRRAIAKTCGFDRDEFNKDPALAKLLDDADLAEENREVDEPLTPIESLRSYLAECLRSGRPIARNRGKPNKAAIAAACGLSRHFLDRHPVAKRLLEQIS